MPDDLTFPGDRIASIEEYEPGPNTFDDGGAVRAATIGTVQINSEKRSVGINTHRQISIPEPGDTIIGVVVSSLPSMLAVLIQYINDKPVVSSVECICSIRNLRKRTVALSNDIVKLRIISRLNGTIHAAISEPDLGVLFTKCKKCGGKVIAMRDGIKCTDCAWTDERKLSSDFGKAGAILG